MTALLPPPVAVYGSVDELLAAARSGLPRFSPRAAFAAVAAGARLVDIRPAWQRGAAGEIPGSLVVERNHLEWRLHPSSPARLPAADLVGSWIVVCTEGYTSSLAAASLRSLGLAATDVDGGFEAWAAAGLPVTRPGRPTGVEQVVASSPAPE